MTASVGPVASAGSQLLLSLILLHLLDPREFGVFSLLLVLSQLSWGVWSALFCAPLLVLMHSRERDDRDRLIAGIFSANLASAVAVLPLFWLLAGVLQVSAAGAVLFAVYVGVALLRWFARAYAYATEAAGRTIGSDLAYAATLTIGGAAFIILGVGSLDAAYGLLLASAVLGMLPFGAAFFRRQFRRSR
jgi:hypothetical protein